MCCNYCIECGMELGNMMVTMKDMNHIYPPYNKKVKYCPNKECDKNNEESIRWW